jgi:hypothetical protein
MQEHVCVEKRQYPNAPAAAAAVRDIWKDHPVSIVSESAHEWCFRACSGWPMTPFPDDNAEEVAQAMFGLDISQINAFHHAEYWANGRFYVLSLSHCWALWAWSYALQRLTEPLTLVHLDAHADLEIPALVCSDAAGRFTAPVGSHCLNLTESASVASFIEHGFIGVGSFIVPLVFANPNCHFVHVEPIEPRPRAPRLAYLEPRRVAHQSLFGVHERPAAVIESEGKQCYLRLSNLDDLARLDPYGSVLLDIDMDYFCNPFEAEEKNGGGGNISCHCWEEIEQAIARVTTVLQSSMWGEYVRIVTVALSPGFFPSRYWAAALANIESGLRRVLG